MSGEAKGMKEAARETVQTFPVCARIKALTHRVSVFKMK